MLQLLITLFLRTLDTMSTKATDNGNTADCRSFGSFGKHQGKKILSYDCWSQPFGKPILSPAQKMGPRKETFLQKPFLSLKKLLKNPFAQSSISVREPQSLDECKSIIRELALRLKKVSQYEEHLPNGSEEDYTVAQGQQFVLQWADELRNQPQCSVGRRLKTNKPGVWRTGEKQEATKPLASAEEKRLKEGQNILSEWAWSLKALPQKSVCPGEDVCAVLQELGRQWKRGQLPNILPVMEFIMWSVIREQPQPGTIPQLWLKSKQRYKHTAAVKHIPASVWKWICEASVDIVLDPKTAHPNIILSPDRKRARVDKIIESKQNCMDGHYREAHNYLKTA
ncbi:hypothetical protein MATL_G00151710 [Megalops atlanticus]|uniref:Uncharacterized protein n=1 Tax=Megalops atlanticus TaxID=7932 RepID=A0A9D3PT21_MEGAT|nr:hypothetical protein MATL_G00151710 [Megalops atlanticus]